MSNTPPPPPLDHAHQAPPPHIRAIHKTLQKALRDRSPCDIPILDFAEYDAATITGDPLASLPEHHRKRLMLTGRISKVQACELFRQFQGSGEIDGGAEGDVPVFEHSSVPGLRIIPALLPLATQHQILSSLLLRDLADTKTHATNLHLHYKIPTPFQFFSASLTTTLDPIDHTVHKPLTMTQVLNKKLRWMTLGGQYDWTAKQYPEKAPGDEPAFPADVGDLIHGLFPDVIPQAAILNIYNPPDTLAPHRDVSEASTAPLVSLSIGCSGVFVIALDGTDTEVLAIRLNSGDAVVMGGASRWAWHSVPAIERGTCPPSLTSWPSTEPWEGWLENRRINLNVRQMWD
ncbi:oxidoreductase [Geopyxis carbonaria]|nr:oxidoreductase [Geopyxis carbonaria]